MKKIGKKKKTWVEKKEETTRSQPHVLRQIGIGRRKRRNPRSQDETDEYGEGSVESSEEEETKAGTESKTEMEIESETEWAWE